MLANLRVVLTDDEVREKSEHWPTKHKVNQLRRNKRTRLQPFGSEIKEARGEITKLSQLVTSGYELP